MFDFNLLAFNGKSSVVDAVVFGLKVRKCNPSTSRNIHVTIGVILRPKLLSDVLFTFPLLGFSSVRYTPASYLSS
jgi:hypothetical protein